MAPGSASPERLGESVCVAATTITAQVVNCRNRYRDRQVTRLEFVEEKWKRSKQALKRTPQIPLDTVMANKG